MSNKTVRIGHASSDERKKITGGAAGDQTGGEVCVRTYYKHKKKWIVFRPKDAEKAELIAVAMERACANDMIGYDQNQRDSLWNAVKGLGWDPAEVKKKVECDCSSLVRVCIAFAFGRDLVGNIRTVSMPDILPATGQFELLTDSKHCDSSDYLRRGDILCTPVSGHTAVVLDNGPKVMDATTAPAKPVVATEPAQRGRSESRNAWYTTDCNLCLRNGAGTKANKYGKDKHTLVKIPKGTRVRCWGYYTKVGNYDWLLVDVTIGGVPYTGFCSKSHLKKE